MRRAVKRLRLTYADLLLLHWPSADTPLGETIVALAALQEAGLARAIGVSNFPIGLLGEIRDVHGVALACNQIECHPLLTQTPMLAFARSAGLVIAAHSPLAQGRLVGHPLLARIGAWHGKSASQVALRWIVQQGMVAIPKTASEERMRENLALFDFELDADEMQRISGLDAGVRVVEARSGA
jgi:2,5-diketo-D-gluconate reductase B